MSLKPETRDNINLIVTVLAFLLIPCGGAFLNAKMDTQTATITAHSDANVSALKQSITENFELKTDHATDIGKITQWNMQLQDSQKEMGSKLDDVKINIQKLTDTIEIQKGK